MKKLKTGWNYNYAVKYSTEVEYINGESRIYVSKKNMRSEACDEWEEGKKENSGPFYQVTVTLMQRS